VSLAIAKACPDQRDGDPVLCRYSVTPSSRFSVVVAEEPAEPLAETHPAVVVGCQRRIDHYNTDERAAKNSAKHEAGERPGVSHKGVVG